MPLLAVLILWCQVMDLLLLDMDLLLLVTVQDTVLGTISVHPTRMDPVTETETLIFTATKDDEEDIVDHIDPDLDPILIPDQDLLIIDHEGAVVSSRINTILSTEQ